MPGCPRCGEQNPERARFCLACGASFSETRSSSTERRAVSILLVDLVGFATRDGRVSTAEIPTDLQAFHSRVRQEIGRFGGTIEPSAGQATMAVFGAPVAHEDDPERAVRAALRITEAVEEMNETQERMGLAVRAAVHTGDAIVNSEARSEAGEPTLAGEVVDTASRLLQVAPIGGVAVSEPAHEPTADVFDYQELYAAAVPGRPDPLPVWLACAVRSRYGVDFERASTPFVGRDFELTILKNTFARMRTTNSIQLVTVTGEAGIGKSRLLYELYRYLDDMPDFFYWRLGRCLPYGGGITFWALREMVKVHVGVLESDTSVQASHKLNTALSSLVAEPDRREWLRAHLAALVGAAETEALDAVDRDQAFAGWRAFLETVANLHPLIALFEDLHWADDGMLDFLEELAARSSDAPILVVCTTRPELFERRPEWGGGSSNAFTVVMPPLPDEDVAGLIDELLSHVPLPRTTELALLERARGNPLFTEEFARLVVDRGFVIRDGGGWRTEADGGIGVPDTVEALIADRLQMLRPDLRTLLQDASVVGKVFWSGALAAVGEREEGEVRERLRELVRRQMVRPARTPSSVRGEAEYGFAHVLVRDVAYEEIPPSMRAAKHRRVAGWIERMGWGRVEDHAEMLAHHYGEALSLSWAAGQPETARELEDPAARFLTMAGDRALHLDAGRAAAYFQRALQLLPPGHPGRAPVLVRARQAAGRAGTALVPDKDDPDVAPGLGAGTHSSTPTGHRPGPR